MKGTSLGFTTPPSRPNVVEIETARDVVVTKNRFSMMCMSLTGTAIFLLGLGIGFGSGWLINDAVESGSGM